MLIGEYETKLTEKNRLALPKKFREGLGSKIIVTAGYEGCLIVVNEQMFTNLTKEILEGRFINDAVRDTTRFLIGSAHEIEMDTQGRFVLPQPLKAYANISQEATFLGLMRWVEIWDKEVWDKRKANIAGQSSEIATKLENSLKTNV
jgi:MraZ protein